MLHLSTNHDDSFFKSDAELHLSRSFRETQDNDGRLFILSNTPDSRLIESKQYYDVVGVLVSSLLLISSLHEQLKMLSDPVVGEKPVHETICLLNTNNGVEDYEVE